MATFIFDHVHPKSIEITFRFPEFAPACKKAKNKNKTKTNKQKKKKKKKKSSYSICSFLGYSQFQGPVTRLATPFFHQAHPKIFDQFLFYMNMYQYAQNQDILVIDKKIPQPD